MQREDGSTDRKALVGKLGDEGERKRATAKEVAAAGKLERQRGMNSRGKAYTALKFCRTKRRLRSRRVFLLVHC